MAKCKLCNAVIESFHEFDYVECKCGEIAISGGNTRLQAFAKDFKNFLRTTAEGLETEVTVTGMPLNTIDASQSTSNPSYEELLKLLEDMIKNIESLPSNALHTPISHYDLLSSLLLISALFRAQAR